MKKRTSFLLLTVVISFVLTSCTSPSASPSTTGATQKATTVPQASTTVATTVPTKDLTPSGGISLPLVDKPIKLTWFWEADPKATAVISSYDKMAYFQEMAKRTNITIEFKHPPLNQASQQFALMLSTNDLPDIVWYNWTLVPGGIAPLIKDGTILNLKADMAKYAPNITKMFKENPTLLKEATLDDGSFFSFPKIKGDASILVTTGLQIRKDWLTRLNLAEPVTIDDWYKVLTAFKTKDANGDGNATDEIPYVGLSSATNFPLDGFANAWNLRYNDFSVRGDKVVFGPITPEYKSFVETMAKWYAEGLIDPDYLATDAKIFESKIVGNTAGSYMGTINGNMGKFLDVWKAAGKTDYDLVPLPNAKLDASSQRYGRHVQSFVSADGAAITSKNKYVKETMMYLDYGYSPDGSMLSNYGILGDSYTMVNNKPVFTDVVLKNPNKYPVINALHLYNFAVSQGPGIQFSDTFFQTATNARLNICYPVFSKDHIKINMPNLSASPDENTKLSSILGDAKTLVEEKVNKFIMGIEPLKNYDAFVTQLKNLKIEEAVAIEQAMFDRFNNK